MSSLDANVLIYRADLGGPNQSAAIDLLDKLFTSEENIFLCWEVLHAFRRIVTNPRAVTNPFKGIEADAFIDAIISHPLVITLSPTKESWQIFKRYSREMKLTGNLVTDALIASQLEANGVKKLYSNDRDFRKFSYLRVTDPFVRKRR